MFTPGLTNAAGVRNTRYYTSRFNQYEGAGGAWKPSWNWAVFVCSTGRFLFRRMFWFGVAAGGTTLVAAAPAAPAPPATPAKAG